MVVKPHISQTAKRATLAVMVFLDKNSRENISCHVIMGALNPRPCNDRHLGYISSAYDITL